MNEELKEAMKHFNKIEGEYGNGFRDGWKSCFRVLTSFTEDIREALKELNSD